MVAGEHSHSPERPTTLDLLRETGAVLTGHFLLTSGYHSRVYIRCAQLLQYPEYAETVGAALADVFLEEKSQVVVGPAIGAIVLSHLIGNRLRTRSLFAERGNDKLLTFRRGFFLNAGERTLICDDVVESGRSLGEVIKIVETAGAVIVGIGALVDRRRSGVTFNYPFHALTRFQAPVYSPQDCPLCAEGVPLVAPGSRFLDVKGDRK